MSEYVEINTWYRLCTAYRSIAHSILIFNIVLYLLLYLYMHNAQCTCNVIGNCILYYTYNVKMVEKIERFGFGLAIALLLFSTLVFVENLNHHFTIICTLPIYSLFT